MQARWLYVYYKINESDLEDYCKHAAVLFSKLTASPISHALVLKPQLLRRPETKQGVITLMEVYGPMPEVAMRSFSETLNCFRREMSCYSALSLHDEYFDELLCV